MTFDLLALINQSCNQNGHKKAPTNSLLPFKTKINGTTFAEGKNLLSYLKVGMTLILERMPDNPFDHNAIAVFGSVKNRHRIHFGYIPKEDACKIAPIIDAGRTVKCVITAVLGGGDYNIGIRLCLY